MAKKRTLSDGTILVITDMKITRRLDALSNLAANYVIEGCEITPFTLTAGGVASTTNDAANLSAGAVMFNNQIKSVAAATYLVGSMNGNAYATFYIASTANKIASVTLQTCPTHANAWCPDHNAQPLGTWTIPKHSMLIAHVSRVIGVATNVLQASYINNGVKPTLFFNTVAWQKDNFTDIDTQV